MGGQGAEAAVGGLVAAAVLHRQWGSAALECVQWPGLKPSGRALEKLVQTPLTLHDWHPILQLA